MFEGHRDSHYDNWGGLWNGTPGQILAMVLIGMIWIMCIFILNRLVADIPEPAAILVSCCMFGFMLGCTWVVTETMGMA